MNQLSAAETTRVTISLPASLVRELDERLVHGDTTRDTAIQRLIEAAFDELDVREQRRAEREEWVRAWQEHPETDEEFGWTTSSAALAHLAEIPWDSDAARLVGRPPRPMGTTTGRPDRA